MGRVVVLGYLMARTRVMEEEMLGILGVTSIKILEVMRGANKGAGPCGNGFQIPTLDVEFPLPWR
jgi:hypothetical protein